MMPSLAAIAFAIDTASGVATWPHSSTTPRGASDSFSFSQVAPSINFEWKPGIQPTMPCLAIGAPTCTRASEGSSAMI